MIKKIFTPINEYKINLHIVTDPLYCKLGGKYLCKCTYNVLKTVFKNTNINFYFYTWNVLTFNSIASKCDLALIPIPRNNPFLQSKPENKLILLWFIGLPVITSDTKSYIRVMNDSNLDFACDNYDQWKKKILQLADSQQLRELYISKAKKYLKDNYSQNLIFSNYDSIFFSPIDKSKNS